MIIRQINPLRYFLVFAYTISFTGMLSAKSSKTSVQPTRSLIYKGFSNIVSPLLKAVVNISTVRLVPTYALDSSKEEDVFSATEQVSTYKKFFNKIPNQRRIPTGTASGFIVDPRGFIVTSRHAVDKAKEILVTLSDGQELKAKIVANDPQTDLSLLKVEPTKPLRAIKWGKSSKVRVGDWAIAIGNALGLGGTVTVGVISYVGRSFSNQPSHVGGFFQTDAAINLGNSGGPLFNTAGEVIGINMMMASTDGASTGVGFAIPSSIIQKVITQLQKYGYVKRGWLGIRIQELTPEIAKGLGLEKPTGALVVNVFPNSPAHKAGVEQGDLILKIGRHAIKDSRQLPHLVSDLPENQKIGLLVRRLNSITSEYEEKKLFITLKNKVQKQNNFLPIMKKNLTTLSLGGLSITNCKATDTSAEKKKGVLVTKVDPRFPVADLLKKGDIILKINNVSIANVGEAVQVIKKADTLGKHLLLCLIRRQESDFFITWNISPPQSPKGA